MDPEQEQAALKKINHLLKGQTVFMLKLQTKLKKGWCGKKIVCQNKN